MGSFISIHAITTDKNQDRKTLRDRFLDVCNGNWRIANGNVLSFTLIPKVLVNGLQNFIFMRDVTPFQKGCGSLAYKYFAIKPSAFRGQSKTQRMASAVTRGHVDRGGFSPYI